MAMSSQYFRGWVMVEQRYIRNISTLTEEENFKLGSMQVAVVGLGGLGGYVLEMLGRIGVGHLTAVDGDTVCASNLNRQLLADTGSIGKSKALMAQARMAQVNPLVRVKAVDCWLTSENARRILANHHVVVDALDNVPGRLLLEECCACLDIPLVHGAIAGWYGQVTTVLPGDNTLSRLYPGPGKQGIEAWLGNPSFTPALVAALEVAEVIKLLIGRGELLSGGEVLFVDTLNQEYVRTKV